MYKKFFKLDCSPFKLTPDTDCFFVEGSRKAILDALIYSIGHGDGICKVIGEVGSGKTLLSRILAKSLPDKFEILYLINPRISPDKILYAIAIELGLKVEYADDKVWLLHLLHSRLLELHQMNKQTVLLIDEAQTIPLESLEEIRMLGNLETGQHKLLQIVLFGQPELDQNLKKHEVRQIKERIIHHFYLPKLTANEVGRYLYYRMQKAGFQGVFPFSTLAVRLIAIKSGGFLRRVNILADKCLLAAFSRQSKKVGLRVALQVIFESHAFSKFFFIILFFVAIGFGLTYQSQRPSLLFTTKTDELAVLPSTVKPLDTVIKVENTQNNENEHNKPIFNEESLKEKPIKPYTIQLLMVSLKDNQRIHTVLMKMIPESLWKNVRFFEKKGRVYKVILGDYLTPIEAKKMMQKIPQILRKNKPYIVLKDKLIENYQPLIKKNSI